MQSVEKILIIVDILGGKIVIGQCEGSLMLINKDWYL